MDWKDTVMSDEGFVAEFKKMEEGNATVNMPWMWGKQVARAQAEISFKAGIREVVNWVAHNIYEETLGGFSAGISRSVWQAKLREWGIDANIKRD